MKYRHHHIEYEIPDTWLAEADVCKFKSKEQSYRSSSPPNGEVFMVLIDSVEPLAERAESRGVFCEDRQTGTSARDRVLRILRWFRDDHEVEPVKVVKSRSQNYEYKLIEGCHRFHCANAMGFKYIPAVLGFDVSDPYA